jgi:hypothetical protein
MNIVTIRKTAQCQESEVIYNSNLMGQYLIKKHTGDIVYDRLRVETNHIDKNEEVVVCTLKKFNTEKITRSVLNNLVKDESNKQIAPTEITNSNNLLVSKNGSGSNHINALQISNLTSMTKYRSCCICDFYIDKSVSLSPCQHALCEKCLKSFYENRIEAGYTTLMCPIYSCGSTVQFEQIKAYISDVHYERLVYDSTLLLVRGNQYSKSVVLMKHVDLFKTYLKKNVLDISDDNSYVLFNKFKGEFCEKCQEPALYGRLSGNMIKCLNCFNKYCKFCFKNVTDDHFDRSANKHCKIFFRKKSSSPNATVHPCWKNFGMAFLIIWFSYFLLITGSYFQITQFLNFLTNKSKLLYPLKLIFLPIFFLLWIVLAMIVLPFYPILFNIIHS